MGRPAKSLEAHIREGTFRARREPHEALLAGPAVRWALFADLQRQYLQARSEPERRAVALAVERHIAAAQTQLRERIDAEHDVAAQLLLPGKAGMAQLLGF